MREEVTHEDVLASLAAREQERALTAVENRHYVDLMCSSAEDASAPLMSSTWVYYHDQRTRNEMGSVWRSRNYGSHGQPVTSHAYRVHRAAFLLGRERRKRMRDEVRHAVMMLDADMSGSLMRYEMVTDALVTLRRALANERLL